VQPGFFAPPTARDQGSTTVKRDRILYDQFSQQQRDAYTAFEDWKNSPDGQRYAELEQAQRAAGPYGSAAEKAWYKQNEQAIVAATNARNAAIREITTKTGANPIEAENVVGKALYSDFNASNPNPKDLTVYGSGSGGGYRTSSRSSRSSRARGGNPEIAAAIQGRNDFYTFFDGLTKQEQAALHDVKGLDTALAKGARLSSQEWGDALKTAQGAIPTIRETQQARDAFYQFFDGLSGRDKAAIYDLAKFDIHTATADDYQRALTTAQDRLNNRNASSVTGNVRTAFYDRYATDSPMSVDASLIEKYGEAGAKAITARQLGVPLSAFTPGTAGRSELPTSSTTGIPMLSKPQTPKGYYIDKKTGDLRKSKYAA
jgi:hypothetical protein